MAPQLTVPEGCLNTALAHPLVERSEVKFPDVALPLPGRARYRSLLIKHPGVGTVRAVRGTC